MGSIEQQINKWKSKVYDVKIYKYIFPVYPNCINEITTEKQ